MFAQHPASQPGSASGQGGDGVGVGDSSLVQAAQPEGPQRHRQQRRMAQMPQGEGQGPTAGAFKGQGGGSLSGLKAGQGPGPGLQLGAPSLGAQPALDESLDGVADLESEEEGGEIHLLPA